MWHPVLMKIKTRKTRKLSVKLAGQPSSVKTAAFKNTLERPRRYGII